MRIKSSRFAHFHETLHVKRLLQTNQTVRDKRNKKICSTVCYRSIDDYIAEIVASSCQTWQGVYL